MKLVLLSGNTGKLIELQGLLGESFDEILTYTQWAGKSFEVEEDGQTFSANAIN